MSNPRTGSKRQARMSLAFKEIFWFTLAILGFMLTWLRPALSTPLLLVLVGFAAVSALASIWIDAARGANVVLWTALLLVVGAIILGLFFWIYQSYAIDPPSGPFFPRRTPTPAP